LCGMRLDNKKWITNSESDKHCEGLIFVTEKPWESYRPTLDMYTKCPSNLKGEELARCNLIGYRFRLARYFHGGMIGCRLEYVLKPIENFLRSMGSPGKKAADYARKAVIAAFRKLGLAISCDNAAKFSFQSDKVTGGAYFKDDKGNTFVPSIKIGNIKSAAFDKGSMKGKPTGPFDRLSKLINADNNLKVLKVETKATNVCGASNNENFAARASKCTAAIAADMYGDIKNIVSLFDMLRCMLFDTMWAPKRMLLKGKEMAEKALKKGKEAAEKVAKKAKEKKDKVVKAAKEKKDKVAKKAKEKKDKVVKAAKEKKDKAKAMFSSRRRSKPRRRKKIFRV